MKTKKIVTFFVSALIIIGLYFVYFVPYQSEKKLLEKGILAKGTLLKIEDKEETFNEKPILHLIFEVKNTKGEKWKATATQVISFGDLYKLIPGNNFNLKYNPENKSEILIFDDKINFETTN